MPNPTNNPLKLFYCYAHQDKELRDALDNHLSILKRQKLIEIWYDGKISRGVKWEDEIDKHLSSADIVLLLVSAAFLASDYWRMAHTRMSEHIGVSMREEQVYVLKPSPTHDPRR